MAGAQAGSAQVAGARSGRSQWRPEAPASRTWLRREHSASHGAGSEQDGGVQVGAWPGRRSWSSACQAAWDRVVTCLGPVNTQPKGLLSHAYEIGGSTEVLAPVTLGHIGQAEACVGLHTLTDPGLRGQETRLRRALSSWAERPCGRGAWSGPRHGGGPRGTEGPARLCQAGSPPGGHGSTSPWWAVISQDAPSARPPTSAQSVALQAHPREALRLPSPGVPAGPGSP